MNTENRVPDYDYSADCKILSAMLCTMLTPAAYGAFAGYFLGAMKYVWIFGAAVLASALFLCGQAVQRAGAKLLKFDKPKFDQIGRASVGKECVRRCRSRWSPYH